MTWHDICDPQDPELDRLAEQYGLHPLHIEDCRHRDQRAKLEVHDTYLFLVLKTVELSGEFELTTGDFDLFVHPEYVITVQEMTCASLAGVTGEARRRGDTLRSDWLMYRALDALVDSYLPVLDRISGRIDELEDTVVDCPEPKALQEIFDLKRTLMELRRIFANTRDVVAQLQRVSADIVHLDLQPFLRDIYDHVTRDLDAVELQRDMISSTVDIYLSGLSNRTNSVMKALTVVSTLSLPAIVIAGIYGMNLRHLPWADHPHAWGIVTGLIAVCCVGLLTLLRWLRFI